MSSYIAIANIFFVIGFMCGNLLFSYNLKKENDIRFEELRKMLIGEK